MEAAGDARVELDMAGSEMLSAEVSGIQALLEVLWACPLPDGLSLHEETPNG